MEERTCNRCPYLSLTEAEQLQLRKWGLDASQHVCNLFNRIIKHKQDSDDLVPCEECVSDPFSEEVSDEPSNVPVLQ